MVRGSGRGIGLTEQTHDKQADEKQRGISWGAEQLNDDRHPQLTPSSTHS
jgi:hypothetical protein